MPSRTRVWCVDHGRSRGRLLVALAAAAVVLLGFTGCDNGAAPPASAPTRLPTPTATSTSTATAAPSPPTAGLSSCPSSQPFASLPKLAHTDLSPDDLLALPDGSLWVTDPVGGSIEHLAADGHVLARIADRQAPEGMVVSGNSIVLAEQTPNRLVSFVPPSSVLTPLLTLPPPGNQAGVDGIGLDAVGGRLLIPDSAHGTLLSADAGGRHVVTLASGLGRDVAATVGPDGAIYVAVEGDHGLLRVASAGGAGVPVGPGLVQLDDLVTVGPLIYATLLIAGEVVAIEPATGAFRVLATGIGAAQGLALLANGRLAVADSNTHVIATVPTCAA